MVGKGYPPWIGGTELYLAQLSTFLAASGEVDVRVIVGQERRGGFSEELIDGVVVQRATTVARVASTPIALGLPRLLRSSAPDLFHFHSPYPWGEAAALVAGVRQPFVVTWYQDVVRQKLLRPFYQRVLDRLLARAQRIIVWSEAIARSPSLERHGDKVVVIPGGVDTKPFVPTPQSRARAAQLRASLDVQGTAVLFVGRLVASKGVDVLLSAMRTIDGTLLIVGNGAHEARLRTLAVELGLAKRVRFLPGVARADLPLYYQASDLLALPSTKPNEAFGLVQVEAHASGIPSICTALGTGTTEVNRDGETGLVVQPSDIGGLADAIRRLGEDPTFRERLGRHAQERALAEFDISLGARRILDLYRAVLRR